MIVDAHAHAFPHVHNQGVYASVQDHLRHLQRHMTTHPQGGRRFRDNGLSPTPTLWDGKTPGLDGLLDVNFRVGPYGRFEWEHGQEAYYLQFFPVSLEVMEARPERMLAQMQYAGVDRAMLQFAKMYGLTNEYLSDCVRRWPDRFRACTAIEEDIADQPAQIEALRQAVREQGLTALYFDCNGFGRGNFALGLDDPRYAPFWEEVRLLEIPVLWDIRLAPWRSSHPVYMEQVERLHRVVRRTRGVAHVLTHGVPPSAFDSAGQIPQELWNLLGEPGVFLEVLFPILYGSSWDYPYAKARPILRQLHERLGAGKLIWGSDMPNVERNCTYAQSLNYLRHYCPFIPASDMDRILGGNASALYFERQPSFGPATAPSAAQEV